MEALQYKPTAGETEQNKEQLSKLQLRIIQKQLKNLEIRKKNGKHPINIKQQIEKIFGLINI